MTWQIRPYQPGDECELAALFGRVFGRSIDEAHWRWKLAQQPSPAPNVWVASDGDGLIFQYAGIPARYHLPGGGRPVMVLVDVMTAAEYRRQGILSQAARIACETWRRAGVAFVISVPGEQWGSRRSALGWEKLFRLQWLVRPLRVERVIARRWRMPLLKRAGWLGAVWNRFADRRAPRDVAVCIRPVAEAGPEFDRLWRACAGAIRVSAIRDRAWVNWRYLSAPSFDYRVLLAGRGGEPAGYVAYRIDVNVERRIGAVVEVFAHPGDVETRHAIIRRAVTDLHADGIEQILALAVPGSACWHALRRAGFLPRPRAFDVQIIPLDPAVPLDVLRDPGHWEMAGGEFDMF
jgi:hypothetical protein